MDSKTKKRTFYYQITIYSTLFIGYGCYAFNRKSVSLAIPKLMEFGLTKSDAGKLIFPQRKI